MWVYEIVNMKNGHKYIGATTRSPQKRWKEHKRALMGGYHYNKPLQSSWNKHGLNEFSFHVIHEANTISELDELETVCNREMGYYNVRLGGEKLFNHSDETKQKMSAAKRGRPPNNKGKTLGKRSTEVRKMISRGHRPNGYPDVVSPNGSIHNIGVLRQFCKEHDLDSSGMSKVINGIHSSCKGWTLVEK